MVYKTVSCRSTDEFTEKKSRFIGHCMPVQTESQAQDFIKHIKEQHRDANHNVWAYSLRSGGIQRYSDDGEPQGTAGVPVLDVLRKSDTIDAVLVVTRYFGGILLGAGGLVRAYSHGASIALQAAEPVIMRECGVYSAVCPYARYTKLQELVGLFNGVVLDTSFEADVCLKFYALPENMEEFRKKFADLTAGKGLLKELEKAYFGFTQ